MTFVNATRTLSFLGQILYWHERFSELSQNLEILAVSDITDGFFRCHQIQKCKNELFGFDFGGKIYVERPPQRFIASHGLFHQRLTCLLRNHVAIDYTRYVLCLWGISCAGPM